jgi:hypothetical protein
MRSSIVVAGLVAATLTGCSGTTAGPSSKAGVAKPSVSVASPTTSGSDATPATDPAGVVTNLVALQAVTAYPKAAGAASRARNVNATKAIQTGPLLALSLADYRYTKRAGKKPIRTIALSSPGTLIPTTGDARRWFLSTAYSSALEANYVSLFEASGTRWRKSTEIWLGNNSFPEPTVTTTGAAQLPDRRGAALDAAAVKGLAHYLATGKRPARLRSAGEAGYLRAYLNRSLTKPYGATGHLSCAPAKGAGNAALATGGGTVVVASLTCTLAKQARTGWILYLKGRWKGLADRSSNLHSFSVHFNAQVAMTVSRTGDSRVIGLTWGSVAISSH